MVTSPPVQATMKWVSSTVSSASIVAGAPLGLSPDQLVPRRFPGPHAPIHFKDVGIAQRGQHLGRRRAHRATAAVEHDARVLVRQFIQVIGDLVERNEQVGLGDLAIVRDVRVDQESPCPRASPPVAPR